MSEKYNGYTNRETFMICLWFDNDYDIYHHFRAVTEEILEMNDKAEAKFHLSDYIESWVIKNNPLANESTAYSDLLSNAIAAINFDEIAGDIISEYEDSETGSNDEGSE